ncbi:hypothetical protein WJX73_002643 [Symbiochloris irregularis]|uniref:Uncharacterized protein n=1 Tax=Symbiochloris irregularis TaxID=706552 RepID=A0AAW1PWU0_9CHLO
MPHVARCTTHRGEGDVVDWTQQRCGEILRWHIRTRQPSFDHVNSHFDEQHCAAELQNFINTADQPDTVEFTAACLPPSHMPLFLGREQGSLSTAGYMNVELGDGTKVGLHSVAANWQSPRPLPHEADEPPPLNLKTEASHREQNFELYGLSFNAVQQEDHDSNNERSSCAASYEGKVDEHGIHLNSWLNRRPWLDGCFGLCLNRLVGISRPLQQGVSCGLPHDRNSPCPVQTWEEHRQLPGAHATCVSAHKAAEEHALRLCRQSHGCLAPCLFWNHAEGPRLNHVRHWGDAYFEYLARKDADRDKLMSAGGYDADDLASQSWV